MQHAEAILTVRKKINEVIAGGALTGPAAEQVQTLLLQLLNECERNRQKNEAAIAELKRQIAVSSGEINAWTAVSSVVMHLLNGYIDRAKLEAMRVAQSEQERQENVSEREAAIARQKAKEDGAATTSSSKVPEKKRRLLRS